MQKAEQVEKMVNAIMEELQLVHSGKYEPVEAKKTAALALQAQMELAQFLSDLEGKAKLFKLNAENQQSIIYFECKAQATDKKISEATLEQMVIRASSVMTAKKETLEAEQDFKKWSLVFSTLKEAHIFFRNLGNGKNEWLA